MEPAKQKPGIGVAVVVWENERKERLLLGLGHSAQNKTEIYAVPGGHWESGETLVEAIQRETLEEAGIEIKDITLISVYEFYNPEKQKSYVTIGFSALHAGGQPTVLEADKKSDWAWHDPHQALSLPLFVPDKILIERSLSGIIFELAK
jgi:ADP-ribose pyrophosphatase YjhB (NUDIX family)